MATRGTELLYLLLPIIRTHVCIVKGEIRAGFTGLDKMVSGTNVGSFIHHGSRFN